MLSGGSSEVALSHTRKRRAAKSCYGYLRVMCDIFAICNSSASNAHESFAPVCLHVCRFAFKRLSFEDTCAFLTASLDKLVGLTN